MTDSDKIGRYFSAMSNEANLRPGSGVADIWREQQNSQCRRIRIIREAPERLQKHKQQQIAASTETKHYVQKISIRWNHPQGRVVLFEIPVAPRGMPIAWKAALLSRRAGRFKVHLDWISRDEIRPADLVAGLDSASGSKASLSDLDEAAVAKGQDSMPGKLRESFSIDEVMGGR